MRIGFVLLLLLSMLFPLSGLCKNAQVNPLELLREKALAGEKESAFFLADAYFYGKNVRKNPVLAAYWYRIAAQKGVVEAQYNLACCLESGSGCRSDPAEAFAWYRKAAQQQFAPAMLRMFHFYRTGLKGPDGKEMVTPSLSKGIALLRTLSAKGHPEAQILLAGTLLRKGSTEKEQKEAFTLLQFLSSKPEVPGVVLRMLSDCYYGGLGCEKNPEKTVSLLRKAAAKKDPEAVAKLGFLLEYGLCGLAIDLQEAFVCYRQSALLGHPLGQWKYAEHLYRSAAGKKDAVLKALKWYRRSASQECVQALHFLGGICREGIPGILKKDLKKAAGCFFRAAKSGYAPSQYELARMFQNKQIHNRVDNEAAFYWFLQAAIQGHLPSIHQAAECYLEGRGVERSYVNGMRLLRAAAEKGDYEAARRLQSLRLAEEYSGAGF